MFDLPLTPREQQYVEGRLLGMTPEQAAKRCGFSDPTRAALVQEGKVRVREALQTGFAETRQKFEVTRDQVVEGIQEGIQIARMVDDAGNVIRGWTEIARICGLVAPVQSQVKVDIDVVQVSQLKELSDAQLLELLGKTRTLDGEYENVDFSGTAGPLALPAAGGRPADLSELQAADDSEAVCDSGAQSGDISPDVHRLSRPRTGGGAAQASYRAASGKGYSQRNQTGRVDKKNRRSRAAEAD